MPVDNRSQSIITFTISPPGGKNNRCGVPVTQSVNGDNGTAEHIVETAIDRFVEALSKDFA